MIKIVRLEGWMMMGDLELNVMKKPRVFVGADAQHIDLVEVAGNPEEILLPPCLQYEVKDQSLIDFYRTKVTGLILAKNVVDIGAVK